MKRHARQGELPRRKGRLRRKSLNLKLDPTQEFRYRFLLKGKFTQYGPLAAKDPKLRIKKKYPYPIMASINPVGWGAEFTLRRSLEFAYTSKLRGFLRKHKIRDPIETMLKHVSYHEIGHWLFPRHEGFGCPSSKPKSYVHFIEPIHEELLASGKFSEGYCKRMAQRLANAVTDIIDNHNVQEKLRERGEEFIGQVLFWYLQGFHAKGYTDDYTLFVKTNLALWPSAARFRPLLQRFMSDNPEIDDSVETLKGIFVPGRIYDTKHWETLARAYAKEAIKYLDESKNESQPQYSPGDETGDPMPDQGEDEKGKGKGKQDKKDKDKDDGDGSGQGQEEDEDDQDDKSGGGQGQEEENDEDDDDNGDGSGQGQEEDEDEGDQDDKSSKGKGKQEERDWSKDRPDPELGKDLSKGDIEKIMLSRKAGKGIPFYVEPDVARIAWYEGLAKAIPMKASGEMPKAQMPLVTMIRERFDPDEHDLGDIDSSVLDVDIRRRRLLPTVARTRMEVPIPLTKEKKELPDFLFALIDSSGSMLGSAHWGTGEKLDIIPWGTDSYYHYALLLYFGMLEFFKRERILHRIKTGGAIFSDETLTARGIDEVKRLLVNPATGGTSIDFEKVIRELTGRRRAVFSLISDGEIGNWESIRDRFIQLAKFHQFFMIQIGRESTTSVDIRDAGLLVKRVDTYEDIVRMGIDLTAATYRGVIHGKLEREAKKYRVH